MSPPKDAKAYMAHQHKLNAHWVLLHRGLHCYTASAALPANTLSHLAVHVLRYSPHLFVTRSLQKASYPIYMTSILCYCMPIASNQVCS